MTRVSSLAIATVAALALAACSGDPVRPAVEPSQSLQSTSLAQLAVRGMGPERVVPGEVIVKMKGSANPAALGLAYGLSLSVQGAHRAFAVLRGPVGRERALAAQLSRDPNVAYAEPNYLRQPTVDRRLWFKVQRERLDEAA